MLDGLSVVVVEEDMLDVLFCVVLAECGIR